MRISLLGYSTHELHNRRGRCPRKWSKGGDPLEAGDFALVNPSEKHQYRNKGDKPFKMICGVPKEFE